MIVYFKAFLSIHTDVMKKRDDIKVFEGMFTKHYDVMIRWHVLFVKVFFSEAKEGIEHVDQISLACFL